MKKRNILWSGIAVFVVVVMVSSAIAVPISHKEIADNTSKNYSNLKDEIYVDPNIRLTKDDLPLLRRSLNQIKDLDYKYVLQRIIKVIEEKEIADSNSIREILLHSDTGIKGIYFNCNVYADSNGGAGCYPGNFRLSIFHFYFNKGGILRWTATNQGCYPGNEKIYVKIDTTEYTTEHEGIALGHFGLVTVWLNGLAHHIWGSFTFDGSAALVFVK